MSKLSISIDRTKCLSCGACAATAPSTFVLDAQMISTVKPEPHDSSEIIKQAAAGCPSQAITVIEEG